MMKKKEEEENLEDSISSKFQVAYNLPCTLLYNAQKTFYTQAIFIYNMPLPIFFFYKQQHNNFESVE